MKNKKISKETFNVFGLDKNIILLGIVSFFNDISSEMIVPILPILIKSLGGTAFTIGLVGGLRDSISSLLRFFSGYLSDREKKRKIFITTGYSITTIFKTLLYFAKNWQYLLIITSLERVGKGVRDAPRDAMISTYSKQKGRALGFHKALDTFGAVNGSLLTFLLYWILNLDLKIIILIAAAISFISLVPLNFVKEKKKKINEQKLSKETFNVIDDKISKKLKLFIAISGLFSLSNFSYMFFILKARNYFSGNNEIVIPLFLYVLFNIFYASFALPIGILSDKIGRKKILISTYFLFSIVCFGFSKANNIYAFIILFILYGIFFAALKSNQKAFVADLSTQNIRATALGLFHTVNGIILLFSSIIAGFMWETFSQNITFIYASSVSFLAANIFLFFYKKL